MFFTPGITESKEQIHILGDPEGLEALGQALILKAKLGRNLHCVIKDGINRPIIECIEDISLKGK